VIDGAMIRTTMTTTTRNVAVCINLARAKLVYADDGIAAAMDKGSTERAFAGCS